jgi:hypothetical protein
LEIETPAHRKQDVGKFQIGAGALVEGDFWSGYLGGIAPSYAKGREW